MLLPLRSTLCSSIEKSKFIELRNDNVVREPTVDCKVCARQLHQICQIHMDKIWPSGFICDGCRKENKIPRKENRFTARRLQRTRLGDHIENRVNGFLRKKEVEDAGEVTIRVLSSSDKIVEVKPGMKKK